MTKLLRRRPKSVNHLDDIFDISENYRGSLQVTNCGELDSISDRLRLLYQGYGDEKVYNIEEISEFSSFLEHHIKNELLKDIVSLFFNKDLTNESKTRHFEIIKDNIIYFNLNNMNIIEPDITVISSNGVTLHINESFHDVFNAKFNVKYEKETITVALNVYFGLLKGRQV